MISTMTVLQRCCHPVVVRAGALILALAVVMPLAEVEPVAVALAVVMLLAEAEPVAVALAVATAVIVAVVPPGVPVAHY